MMKHPMASLFVAVVTALVTVGATGRDVVAAGTAAVIGLAGVAATTVDSMAVTTTSASTISTSGTTSTRNHNKIANRIRDNPRADTSNLHRDNVYNRNENRTRNADRSAVQRDLKQARSVRGQNNNVLADRDGNVARKAGQATQHREGGQWKNADRPAAGSRPATANRPTSRPSQIDRGGVNRDDQARQRGAQRERSAGQMRRSAPRGGGGRRR